MDHHEGGGRSLKTIMDSASPLLGIIQVIGIVFFGAVTLYSGVLGDRSRITELLDAVHHAQADLTVLNNDHIRNGEIIDSLRHVQADLDAFKISAPLSRQNIEQNSIHVAALEAHFNELKDQLNSLKQEESNLQLRLEGLSDMLKDLNAARIRMPKN